jgi:hypothetical protein
MQPFLEKHKIEKKSRKIALNDNQFIHRRPIGYYSLLSKKVSELESLSVAPN